MENIKIWTGEVPGYRLLDSGEKEKLEEINGVRIARKEPRAWWQKSLPESEWQKTKTALESVLDIGIGDIKAQVKFNEKSKHIGIFPEQVRQWRWVRDRIKNYESRIKEKSASKKEIKVLNLFGYTGIASLVAAQAGLKVTHVDASKQSVDWAKENQKISGLEDAPIRWIVDDAIKFLKREAKRLAPRSPSEVGGEKYDAIIMDPPSYGRGPKSEVWKIEDKLPALLSACREVLSDEPLFVIFNMYSTELSALSVANLLSDMVKDLGGQIELGELAICQQNSERLLPMSIFAIWNKN